MSQARPTQTLEEMARDAYEAIVTHDFSSIEFAIRSVARQYANQRLREAAGTVKAEMEADPSSVRFYGLNVAWNRISSMIEGGGNREPGYMQRLWAAGWRCALRTVCLPARLWRSHAGR